MAGETTSTIVANYGHGTRTLHAFNSTGRPRPTIESVVGVFVVPVGHASGQLTLQGAALTAASASESASAATPQALNSLSVATLTPGSYVSAVRPTTEAMNRVDPNVVDLAALVTDEAVYPHRRIVAYDSSIGIVKYQFTQLSNRVGTSGAAMTWQNLLDAYEQLCSQVSATPDVVAWLSNKQWTELNKQTITTSAAIFGDGGAAPSNAFKALLGVNGVDMSRYIASLGPIHIFVDPDPNGFGTASGDTISAMFVPYLAGVNAVGLPASAGSNARAAAAEMTGELPLAPAYAVGYRAEPTAAAMLTIPGNMATRVVTPGGIPIDVLPRVYAGQNLATIDAWSTCTTVEVNDNSGVGIRSVA